MSFSHFASQLFAGEWCKRRREPPACDNCERLEGLLDKAVGLLQVAQGALLSGAHELRRAALARGAEPHWLTKDFNVLYRSAEVAAAQAQLDGYDTAHVRDLRAQLERLATAFADTESARGLTRGGRVLS